MDNSTKEKSKYTNNIPNLLEYQLCFMFSNISWHSDKILQIISWLFLILSYQMNHKSKHSFASDLA